MGLEAFVRQMVLLVFKWEDSTLGLGIIFVLLLISFLDKSRLVVLETVLDALDIIIV